MEAWISRWPPGRNTIVNTPVGCSVVCVTGAFNTLQAEKLRGSTVHRAEKNECFRCRMLCPGTDKLDVCSTKPQDQEGRRGYGAW